MLSQRTLTMFVGVVALRYQHHMFIIECHNSHKHSQSPTRYPIFNYVRVCVKAELD